MIRFMILTAHRRFGVKLLQAIGIASLLLALSWDLRVTVHEWLLCPLGARNGNFVVQLAPEDATPHSRAGELNPDQNAAELEKAIRLNPWDSADRLLLSAQQEFRGETDAAEKQLIDAQQHNTGAAPAWALANFYLRRGDRDRFFTWANRYRSIAEGSHEALLRLAFDNVPNVASLQSRLPGINCEEEAAGLRIADELGADPASFENHLLQCPLKSSETALWQHVSRLLAGNQGNAAQALWKRLGLSANLFNSGFNSDITGEGFDWRINTDPDISTRRDEFNSELEIDLKRGTAEGSVTVFQPVVLAPGHPYHFALTFNETSRNNDCLRAELVELATGKVLLSSQDEWKMVNEQQGEWSFVAPVTSATEALALIYMPPPGVPIEEHALELTSARLEAMSESPTTKLAIVPAIAGVEQLGQ